MEINLLRVNSICTCTTTCTFSWNRYILYQSILRLNMQSTSTTHSCHRTTVVLEVSSLTVGWHRWENRCIGPLKHLTSHRNVPTVKYVHVIRLLYDIRVWDEWIASRTKYRPRNQSDLYRSTVVLLRGRRVSKSTDIMFRLQHQFTTVATLASSNDHLLFTNYLILMIGRNMFRC